MHYNPMLENFNQHTDPFTRDSRCVWVVYPGGAMGDLIAAIINFHYFRTGTNFFGITDRGQSILRSVDQKIVDTQLLKTPTAGTNDMLFDSMIDRINQTLIIQNIIDSINQTLRTQNINYSLTDQIVLANHAYSDANVAQIIDTFPRSQVIRILPDTDLECKAAMWMANYKNNNRIIQLPDTVNAVYTKNFVHERLIEFAMRDFLNPKLFEIAYAQILKQLGLPCKLIRHDLIQFWLDKQHSDVRPLLDKIAQSC